MADRAYLISDTNERIPILASELGRKDVSRMFECMGRCKGKECRAKMIYIVPEVNSSHFRAVSEHAPGCKYDESGKFHVLRNIDQTGYNTSVSELAIKFGVDMKTKDEGAKKGKGEKGGGR